MAWTPAAASPRAFVQRSPPEASGVDGHGAGIGNHDATLGS